MLSCSLLPQSAAALTPLSFGQNFRSGYFHSRVRSEPSETSSGSDSYSKIEAPVRKSIPDGGPPVSERKPGQNVLDAKLKAESEDPNKRLLGSNFSASEVLRFNGALPEVANCRLAMLGVVAALFAEAATGQNVFQQVQIAPVPIALTFVTLTVATAMPIFRDLPRKGNAIWSSDAEIINGRVAMLGFLGLVISTYLRGSAL